ncbi:MAG TPA: hypothetical protein VMS17_10420 [Gemmataceae bacterium]|nr:hypothetical protein [Gemmataceae bacterium]
MIVSRPQISWGVWPLWVAASAAGGALGAAAFWGQGRLIDATRDNPILPSVTWPLSVLVILALPAFLQWLILRRRFPRAGWWIPASAAGSLAGFLFVAWAIAMADTEQGAPAFLRGHSFFRAAIGAATADTEQGRIAFLRLAVPGLILLGGAVAGALQWLAALPWLVLGRWAASAVWWALASSIGWLGATWLFLSVTRAGDAQPAGLFFLLGGAASGALAGAVTGLALVWLLRDTGRSASLHSIP